MSSDPTRRARGWRGAAAAVLAAAVTPALAHEYWIHAPEAAPEAGAPVAVTIGAGHNFPEGETVLADRVLRSAAVRTPDGESAPLETAPAQRRREGAFVPRANGPHLASFTLRRPRREEPIFFGKTVVAVGGRAGAPEDWRLGHGLEIAPVSLPERIETGARIELAVLEDGEPVTADIRVETPEGRPQRLRARAERPTALRLDAPGAYLLVVYRGGVGASLTLNAPPAAGTEP